MAYFGLAHLGPQSSFLHHRPNAYTVAIFALAEFEAAAARVCGAGSPVPLALAPRVLDLVFHGPPPPLEAARVAAALGAAAGGRAALPLADFLAAIGALREAPLEVDAGDYAHYASFGVLRAHKLRQVRPQKGPEATQRAPATLLQEIGFQAHRAVPHEIHFVKKCEETK